MLKAITGNSQSGHTRKQFLILNMNLKKFMQNRLFTLMTLIATTFLLNGCISLMLNDLENKALTQGDIMVRLEVTSDYDLDGRNPYERLAKQVLKSDEFLADVTRFRMTHAEGRTSALGLVIKRHYFFIDDRVPLLGRGDIVDVLYPIKVGPNLPINLDDLDSDLRKGIGATIVRRVCAAKDKQCKTLEKTKHNGKLTGVLFGDPAAEGWPGDFSNIKVSPRAELSFDSSR